MGTMKKLDEIPVSTESVRRRILNTVTQVDQETQVFMERYLDNTESNSSQWRTYIENCIAKASPEKSPDSMEDFKDLEPVLNRLRGDDMSGYAEYNQLRKMIERGKMFEYITFSLKNQLDAAYNKFLKVYCLSFLPEAQGERLESVLAYEERITTWLGQLDERYGLLDDLLDEYDKMKRPVLGYIQQYDNVTEHMHKVCHAMRRCGEPMKKWVQADANYARKVQEEINVYNRRKMDMRDVIKELEDHRDELGVRLKKRAHAILRAERMVTDAREEKRYYKRRINTIRNNLTNAQAEISRKQHDLDAVKTRLTNRKESSPAAFHYLTSLQESLRDEIRSIEAKCDTMEAQIAGLHRDQERCQRDMEKRQVDVDQHTQQHQVALEKVEKAEEDVRLVKEDVRSLDEKMNALKRIREIKLHSDTVKKIYHYGYRPGEMTQMTDELDEAFKLTAEDVGKDWVWLYQKLPFIPVRDYKARSHDLEVIDLGNRRLDGGFETLALKSLEKWRRLSEQASLPNLLHTLRKIQKQDTARRIEVALSVRGKT